MSAQNQTSSFRYGGVNHVALVCRDMAKTVDFYENVLEMPLVRSMGIGAGHQHFFFDCGGGGTIAFFWFADPPAFAPGIASQPLDVRKDGMMSAIASMNHLAINIPIETFDAAVARLRDKGVECNVINHSDGPDGHPAEPTDQTWIRSVYFTDPNGIKMELAALTRPFAPSDILVEPMDEAGKPVPLRHKTPEPAV
ncbi:MAG: VOC family protein [Alphaproteobacteria bacterium]|nr:VOC family protein [Alphaproteobacteria bacterium]MBU1514330.1 VOC family protein [Alphaproteobacteria bacterium]MBU2095974.1 VOC family protein [Alphaproteobacteria bacterium]MBU2153072.1 VOC family protein [Alphaproteobacteria bacterium]MBU2308529.1 VOC family protein [Alphaproteobacteria bacterium]